MDFIGQKVRPVCSIEEIKQILSEDYYGQELDWHFQNLISNPGILRTIHNNICEIETNGYIYSINISNLELIDESLRTCDDWLKLTDIFKAGQQVLVKPEISERELILYMDDYANFEEPTISEQIAFHLTTKKYQYFEISSLAADRKTAAVRIALSNTGSSYHSFRLPTDWLIPLTGFCHGATLLLKDDISVEDIYNKIGVFVNSKDAWDIAIRIASNKYNSLRLNYVDEEYVYLIIVSQNLLVTSYLRLPQNWFVPLV